MNKENKYFQLHSLHYTSIGHSLLPPVNFLRPHYQQVKQAHWASSHFSSPDTRNIQMAQIHRYLPESVVGRNRIQVSNTFSFFTIMYLCIADASIIVVFRNLTCWPPAQRGTETMSHGDIFFAQPHFFSLTSPKDNKGNIILYSRKLICLSSSSDYMVQL